MRHAPVCGVRIGQGRLRQTHIEEQPRCAFTRLHCTAAAADERHVSGRVDVQVQVFQGEALHGAAVKFGKRGSAGDAAQAVSFADQRKRVGYAVKSERLAGCYAWQVPAVGGSAALQDRDVGATAPVRVAQAGKLRSAKPDIAARRVLQNHVRHHACSGASPLHLQPAGVGGEHRVEPLARAGGARQAARQAFTAQQQADRSAVGSFTGLRNVGRGYRQGPYGGGHGNLRSIDVEDCGAVGIGGPARGSHVEREGNGVVCDNCIAGLGVETQVVAEAGQTDGALDHGGTAHAQGHPRRQQHHDRVGIGPGQRPRRRGFGL